MLIKEYQKLLTVKNLKKNDNLVKGNRKYRLIKKKHYRLF